MTTVTMRPDLDIAYTGPTVLGLTEAYVRLSDNNTATSLNLSDTGQYVEVRLGNPSITAGAMTIALRYRVLTTSSDGVGGLPGFSGHLATGFFIMDGRGTVQQVNPIGANNPTEVASAWVPFLNKTQAEADDLHLTISAVVTESPSQVAMTFYEAYVDLKYAEAPVVTVLGPTGTLTTATAPVVQWGYAAGSDGGPQFQYQIKVFSAAQYGAGGFNPDTSAATYDSGIVYGSAPNATTGFLPNHTTYRAYVRAAQNIGGLAHFSAWSFSGFALNVDAPEFTTVVATGDSANHRINVVMTRDGAHPVWNEIEVQHSFDAGATWSFVRGSAGAVYSSPYTLPDYETLSGQSVLYRARPIVSGTGTEAAGAWVSSSAASWTLTAEADRLQSTGKPSLSISAVIQVLPTEDRKRAQGVFEVVGRSDNVIVNDVLQLATGQFILFTYTSGEDTAVEALMERTDSLYLQMRAADLYGSRYLTVGNVSHQRFVNLTGQAFRRWVVSYTEVARPADAGIDLT